MTIPLVTPIDNYLMVGNDLQFVFNIPTGSGKFIFQIEFDTVESIDSAHSDYRHYESREASTITDNQGVWEYYNGTAWVRLATGGVNSSYAGNQARVTLWQQHSNNFLDKDINWYWKVSAATNAVHSIYNIAVFGQFIYAQ